MTSKENPHCGLNVAAVTTVTNPHIIHIEATFGKLEIRSHIGAYKCGFYNPHNSDYLLLWLQSRLCGLCGLFQPQIIWIKGTFNPHFIIREAMKCIVHNMTRTYCCNLSLKIITSRKIPLIHSTIHIFPNYWKPQLKIYLLVQKH